MARGRKPKPIELQEASGNPGRRPLPAPVRTDPLDPTPPEELDTAGRELWAELVQRLGSVGALDQVDRAGLTALCIQWDRAADAAAVLKTQGHYAKGSKGQLVAHPALSIERNAHHALFKFLAEYAATPVARARIATAKAERNAARVFEEIIDADPLEIDAAGEIDADAL